MNEMQQSDPEAFGRHAPAAKKVHCEPLVALGIHHEWACNGHDKLSSRGFPIYGVRDKWSGKWLGLWVLPNNCLKVSIAYIWLSLIAEVGGKLM